MYLEDDKIFQKWAFKTNQNQTYEIQCSLLGSIKPSMMSKVQMVPTPIKSFKYTKKLTLRLSLNYELA